MNMNMRNTLSKVRDIFQSTEHAYLVIEHLDGGDTLDRGMRPASGTKSVSLRAPDPGRYCGRCLKTQTVWSPNPN